MCNAGALVMGIMTMAGSYMEKSSAKKAAERQARDQAEYQNRMMEAQYKNDLAQWEYGWKVQQANWAAAKANAGAQAAYNRRVFDRDMLKYQQQMSYAAAMRKNAKDAYDADTDLLNAQTEQMNKKTDFEQFERKRQQERNRGKIRVAAGESGLSGVSVLRELATSVLNSNYDVAIMETNRKNANVQQEAKADKLKANYQSRLNSAMNPIAPAAPMGGGATPAPIRAPQPVMGEPITANYYGPSNNSILMGSFMSGMGSAMGSYGAFGGSGGYGAFNFGSLFGGSSGGGGYNFQPNAPAYHGG